MSTDRQPSSTETDGGSPTLSEESETPQEERAIEAFTLPQASRPVFYDEQRRRWPWFIRGAVTGLALIVVGAVMLIISLIAIPLMPPTRLPRLAPERDFGNANPALSDAKLRAMGFKQAQEKGSLRNFHEQRRFTRLRRSVEANKFVQGPVQAPPGPIVAGFYVNWEQTSNASLHRNIKALSHFIPEWLHLKPAGANYADPAPNILPFVDAREKQDIADVTPLVRANHVLMLPLINNYTHPKSAEEGAGNWDPVAVHEVVSNPQARANVIHRLRDWLLKEKMQGVNIDFEEVLPQDRTNLVTFMRELYAALHPKGLLVTQDVQLDNDNFDLTNLARYNDWIVPMFYDEHAGGDPPGAVAGIGWTQQFLDNLLNRQGVPADKVVMGVGNHGYDWIINDPKHGAESITYQNAMTIARESQPDAVVRLDTSSSSMDGKGGSLNPTFNYWDTFVDNKGNSSEKEHQVWLEDAVSVYNQLCIAKPKGIRGAALWFVGSEDPSLWSFYDKTKWNSDWSKLVDSGALDTIAYKGQGEVEFQGDGELLQPLTAPSDGKRTLTRDPKTGLITSETYVKDPLTSVPMYPSGWVVRRYGGGVTGNPKKQIVLTFDDGPDPEWTPKILDILKQYHVPAAFFVVGKQAEAHPELVRRMWDEGHEIGNHSWDHPDMFRLSEEHQRLELTTTERLIQAVTGHSTILFRPPYGGDVEPQTGKEVSPMLTAAGYHYITVGEKNDPQDWRLYELKPGSEDAVDLNRPRSYHEIVNSVLNNRDQGCIVLLHDAGGPRENTLQALPEIITRLRAAGYTFVSVSALRFPDQVGKRTLAQMRNELMPTVSGNDEVLVGADRYVFEVSYVVQRTLSTLFLLSIILGVSRVVIFVLLALIQRFREQRRVFPPGYIPSVSVVIAAYNEEKVIARTVQALLDSRYPNMEIIVVDDGSKDHTYDVVMETFADDPRVRAYRKENGGKSTALNRGIMAARGEILISLDADTLFASDTVARLVRHFVNPKVGAVSGNVRVGNVRNIWTRWQALEYITSQNFDRRGYDLLNCITVVPGAVGALRREAVLAVGGYTHDTLAEDTDLTWKLRRAGWRIVNDNSAMAYTEAPETLRNLAKQRFRWAFGTLQCLWKHQSALGQHGAFGWIALPSLWLYQILFPAVSPFMDIYLVYSIFAGNFVHVAFFYLCMFGIELLAAMIATVMDRGNWRLLPWLFLQKFLYRQLMYYVILKSLVAAVRGGAVGWGKFERTGTARIADQNSAASVSEPSPHRP